MSKKLQMVLLGLLVVLSISASTAGSAIAAPQWLICLKSPGGIGTKYDNNRCNSHLMVVQEWEWVFRGAVAIPVVSKGGSQILAGEIGGVSIKIECSSLDNEGLLENPSGEKTGVALLSFLYLGCVVKPAALKCEIPGGMFTSRLTGELEGTESSPVVRLSPDGGGVTLTEISFEKCTQSALNGVHPVGGSILGKINDTDSTISFNEEKVGSMLEFAGSKMSLKGEDLVETSEGSAILAD